MTKGARPAEERETPMRRALLCCALLSLTVTACSSSAATPGPYWPAPAASAAPAQPYATPVPVQPAPPDYPWPTPVPTPYPPVVFPSLGINPYTNAAYDSVSTFGLDVDTASYTVARAYVASGQRPDPNSVRPEEWVNYFDQGYASPETGTFAIYTDGGATPFLSSGEVLLRIGVKARDAWPGPRPPMALTFVIDVSGSMGYDGRLEMVKGALSLLAGQLTAGDRVAIVAFSDTAWVVLNPTLGSDRQRILAAIATLKPLNSTNAEAGLRLGYQLERQQFTKGGINRVVLATDGVANVGNTGSAAILNELGADAASGIQLVAVGVGMGNYNDKLLEELADKGQGFYAYVDSPAEARRIFVDELATTMQTVALNAKAQIEFNPQVVAGYRLIGYEDRAMPDSSFRNDAATGGAIGAGHQVTALYALVLRQPEWGQQRLATVGLRWTDPSSQRAQEIAQDVYFSDLASDFRATSPHFKMASLVAATAEVLRGSPWIPGYRLADLRNASAEMRGFLPQTAQTNDFLSMLDQLGWMGY
jgi:Ca-activated chloride channel family protein